MTVNQAIVPLQLQEAAKKVLKNAATWAPDSINDDIAEIGSARDNVQVNSPDQMRAQAISPKVLTLKLASSAAISPERIPN